MDYFGKMTRMFAETRGAAVEQISDGHALAVSCRPAVLRPVALRSERLRFGSQQDE